MEAKNIVNNYWDVINKKMTLHGRDGENEFEISLDEFPIKAFLTVRKVGDIHTSVTYRPDEANTAGHRSNMRAGLIEFFRSVGGHVTETLLSVFLTDSPQATIDNIEKASSTSQWFNNNSEINYGILSIDIMNPFKSEFPEDEESGNELEQKSSMEEELEERKELEAYDIIDSYWKVINEKMSLIREDGQTELSLNEFPIDAILRVGDSLNGSRSIAFRPNEVNTANKRDTAKAGLIAFFESIEWRVIVSTLSISSSNVLGDVNRVDSESPRFNRDAKFVVNDYGVNIVNPFTFTSEFSEQKSSTEDEPEEHSYISHLPPPPSFRTGRDFVRWMRHILGALSLQDYRSRNVITIVPDSAGIIRMRLQLGWSGDRTLAITPSTIDSELDNIEENELAGSLRTAELRIAASSLHDATPGPFVAKPWESGHVTDSGQLIMNWTASDLSDQSEDEGSDQSEDEE